MPRPRKSTAPVKRRTITGCQACRKRKIKCDEARPICLQCQIKGFECIKAAALKWETEYVSKGLSFGRAGVWSKDPVKTNSSYSSPSSTDGMVEWCTTPEIQAYSFLNLGVGSATELTTLEYVGTMRRMSVTPSIAAESDGTYDEDSTNTTSFKSPSTKLTSPIAGHTAVLGIPVFSTADLFSVRETQERSLLLSYYIEQVCPLTVASPSSRSPLAALLVPFAITTSSLAMDSILALAACHRSRTDPAYTKDALQRSHGALQTLQLSLRDGDLGAIANNPETLAVMLLLCWFEIVNERDKRWVVHLKGARDLVRIRRQITTSQSSTPAELQLSHFCERFFAFQDVMGRTACGEDPLFGSDFWTSESSNCDPWLGCSSELISILARITELGRQSSNSRCALEFQAEAASLEYQLANLKQEVGYFEEKTLGQAAELKRLAAELYLQCVLNGAGPATPWVMEQIPKILRLVAVLLEMNILAGMNWPLFIAAVELDPEQDLQWSLDGHTLPRYARPFILGVLDRLTGSVINVTKARSVIEKVWQARELGDIPLQNHAIEQNDWNHFVAPFCGNMSLA